mgnify:CR=1 FL=1
MCDTDHTHVIKTLNRYNIMKENVERFKANRSDIFAGMQDRLLHSITDEDIQKAPLGSRVLAACQIYDKERTERGLVNSTSAVIHADIEALRNGNTCQYDDVIDLDSDD